MRRLPTESEFKKRFPSIAAQMSWEEIRSLIRNLTWTDVEPEQKLLIYGQYSDVLYLVWKGTLSVSLESDTKAIVLGAIGPGKWVGDITWIQPAAATATVMVTEEGVVLKLPHDGLERLRKDHPGVATALLRAISLELAGRLRLCSAGLLKRADNRAYRLQRPSDGKRGWLAALSRRLAGITGAGG